MTDMSLSQTLVFGHLWQSVAIAAVLASALIIGRRMRGATRYGLGVAAFGASLLLPLAAFIPGETIVAGLLKQLNAPVSLEASAPTKPLASIPLGEIAAPGAPVSASTPVSLNEARLGFAASALSAPVMTSGPSSARPASLFTMPQIPIPDIGLPLLIVWLGVAAVLVGRTIRDLLAVERLVARATPVDLPKALQTRMKGVRVLVSPEAPGPMAAGLLHPAIVLPENLALASPGIAALLEHEHAHIRRQDMLAALGQRVVLALLWWSPALHWISRRMDEEREVACDEAAVDRTGDARAFARSLTTQAENQLWERAPRLAVGAIGPRSQFSRRIRRLIDIAKTGGSPARYSGRLAFAGLAVVVGVAAMITPRFTASAQEQDKPIDLTSRNAKAALNAANGKLEGEAPGQKDEHVFTWNDQDWNSKDWNAKEFADFGKEIEAMMAELAPQLESLGAEFGPEMKSELAGLSVDLSRLGLDISTMVTQDVLSQMPQIMEEVRKSLEAAGIDPEHMDGMPPETAAEVRRALDEARVELRHAFGPEMKAEIRAALAEARDELAAHRDEIAAAIKSGKFDMSDARAAMQAARAELEAARARGDFKFSGPDGKMKFDFGPEVLEELRAAGVTLDGKSMKVSRGGHDRELFEAAEACEMTALSKLLMDSKTDVNRMTPGEGTALMAAVDAGCDDAVRALINAGADVNRGFPGSGTPLAIAVDHGDKAIIDLLLSRGANPDGFTPGFEAPLFAAIEQGNLPVVKTLVEKGANVNLSSPMTGFRRPLDVATDEGQEKIADYLRAKGARISDKRR